DDARLVIFGRVVVVLSGVGVELVDGSYLSGVGFGPGRRGGGHDLQRGIRTTGESADVPDSSAVVISRGSARSGGNECQSGRQEVGHLDCRGAVRAAIGESEREG